jgi:hypothetical protein
MFVCGCYVDVCVDVCVLMFVLMFAFLFQVGKGINVLKAWLEMAERRKRKIEGQIEEDKSEIASQKSIESMSIESQDSNMLGGPKKEEKVSDPAREGGSQSGLKVTDAPTAGADPSGVKPHSQQTASPKQVSGILKTTNSTGLVRQKSITLRDSKQEKRGSIFRLWSKESDIASETDMSTIDPYFEN